MYDEDVGNLYDTRMAVYGNGCGRLFGMADVSDYAQNTRAISYGLRRRIIGGSERVGDAL